MTTSSETGPGAASACRVANVAPASSVVHVYKAFPPVLGGIEGHIDLLTRLLGERGVQAEVLCASAPGAPPLEVRGGVRVRRCTAPLALASTPLPPALPWHLRRSTAAVVHLHSPWPPGEIAVLLGARGRRLIVTLHCEVVRHPRLGSLLAPLTQAVLRRTSAILITGRFLLDAPLLRAHRERVRVVPLGVDLDVFRPDARAADPLPSRPRPRALFVGRLRHYKGLSVLAQAMARLQGVSLVVVGDGPERARFEAALHAAGCRERVHLTGSVDARTLVRLYQTSDVAVLPSTSRAEAFGVAIAEAQACGLPAVTTDVGTGTAQTVADGSSGRVAAANNAEALAGALAWCLDPARHVSLRAAARRHAEANLCARRMAAAVQAAYEG